MHTIAEVREDGMFPCVFSLAHVVDEPEQASDDTLVAQWHGVAGAGFVALDDESAAARWAAQLQAAVTALGQPERMIRAVPLDEARQWYAAYLADHG